MSGPAGVRTRRRRTSRHPTRCAPLPLLPRNAVLALLHGYRATISHTYGDVCKYYPSCSAYAVGAVQQHGAVKGAALTAARIARCHPWAAGGVDDVPATPRFRSRTDPARVRRAVPQKGLIRSPPRVSTLGIILWPLKWLVELVLVAWHCALHLDRAAAGRRHHLGAGDRRSRASSCARR